MNRADATLRLPTEFNEFLWAPVFEDSNGMLLSVLSALARMDMDAWREADELSHMPVSDATLRLQSLIAGLPDRPSTTENAEAIARRLVGLLPRSPVSNSSAYPAVFGAAGTVNYRRFILYFIVIMILETSIQLVMTSRQMPSQIGHSSSQVSSTDTASAQELPTKSGH